jgi:cobalt/nickel transport system permease protein
MKAEFLDHHGRGRSPIHAADPRVKLVLVVLFIMAAATTPAGRWWDYLGLGLILVVTLALTRVSPLHLAGKIAKLAPFVLLMAAGLLFVAGGEPVITWEPAGLHLVVTDRGLHLFANVLCKAMLALGSVVVLVSTTPFPELVQALKRFRAPEVITGSLSLMYRYLFVFFHEKERLLTARESRLAWPSRSLRWKSLAGIVGVLFVRSLNRAERVHQAMESRGFEGAPVTAVQLRTRPYDWIVLFLGIYLIGMVKYVGIRFVG